MFFEALEEEESSSSIASDEASCGEKAWITDWKELLTASMSYRIMTEDSRTRTGTSTRKGQELVFEG